MKEFFTEEDAHIDSWGVSVVARCHANAKVAPLREELENVKSALRGASSVAHSFREENKRLQTASVSANTLAVHKENINLRAENASLLADLNMSEAVSAKNRAWLIKEADSAERLRSELAKERAEYKSLEESNNAWMHRCIERSDLLREAREYIFRDIPHRLEREALVKRIDETLKRKES